MSTYQVDVKLGAYDFTITSGDDPDDADTVQVLDGLSIGWEFDRSEPFPAQPKPTVCQLAFITKDFDALAGVDVGTVLAVRVTSAGTVVAAFAGRVGQPTATPVRFNGATRLRVAVTGVDYTVDLAELPLTLSLLSQAPGIRLDAIGDAIEAALIASGTTDAVGAAALVPVRPATAGLFAFRALDVVNVPAFDVYVDHLRQGEMNADYVNTLSRSLLLPLTTDGELDGYTAENILPTMALTFPPGVFELVAHQLQIAFDGPAPVSNPFGLSVGLAVDAARVDEDIAYSRSKFDGPNLVTVVTDGSASGSGAALVATASNVQPGEPLVRLDLTSSLLILAGVQHMADMYLPGVVSNRWTAERFTWRPTDADLAALTFCLTPDTDNLVGGDVGQPACYFAQVAVYGIPPAINPTTELDFYAGTFSAVTVRVTGGDVLVDMEMSRRLPQAFNGTLANGNQGVTWSDLAADFPTVKIATGVDVVDPDLTWYDTRVVRTH